MCQIKAPIAGKTQSNRCAHGASFSKAIAKIRNAELVHFNKQMLIHELIRDSLTSDSLRESPSSPILIDSIQHFSGIPGLHSKFTLFFQFQR
jgi:hypothetical protein